MPLWRPDCLRGSIREPDAIQYRPATNGGFSGIRGEEVPVENRGTTLVELYKKEGYGMGLIISGGTDKGVLPHVSNIRPGGVVHRSDTLEVGDVILAVNGIRTTNMKHDEIINVLKNADERVVLEIEYTLPSPGPMNMMSVRCKQHTVKLDKDGSSFGFTLRGGINKDSMKSRPQTITQIRPGGSADREGSLKPGDRILSVNDYNVFNLTLAEIMMLLQQCENQAHFTIEYDVSIIDAVQKATGPLLIEIDKTPGAALGISLSHARHQGHHCVCIDSIRPMSVADRCGALHVGDHIMSIDGASVEHMTVAEATQLLKSNVGDQIKFEILPVRLMEKKFSASRDSVFHRGTSPHLPSIMPAISSPVLPTSPFTNGLGSSKSFSTLRRNPSDIQRRRKSWVKTDKKTASCASMASTNSVFVASNQVCRTEIMEVQLYGDRTGLGLSLDGGTFSTCILEEPPIISVIEENSAAERCGVLQEGDRVLSVNGQDLTEKTMEEINVLLRESWQTCSLEVEFDVTDAVTASHGTFFVKLRKKSRCLGLSLRASLKRKANDPLIVVEVTKGSVAYRCGSIHPGDRILSINDSRTENLSVEEAMHLIETAEDIIRLKIKREDPYTDASGEECISYTVELQRHGGPLGITITGSDEAFDPIVISELTLGGLAERTGAIHVGDRLLAVNGVYTRGRTVTDSMHLLQSAGDRVTLKIARPAQPSAATEKPSRKSVSSDKEEPRTPVRSIDSALESWDSSGQDIAVTYNGQGLRPVQSAIMPRVNDTLVRPRPYSDDSLDTPEGFEQKLTELRISDEAWEGDLESSESSPDDSADKWSQSLEQYSGQSEMLQQIANSIREKSTASLDRKSLSTSGKYTVKNKKERNWSHSTSRGAHSEDDLRPKLRKGKQNRDKKRTKGSAPKSLTLGTMYCNTSGSSMGLQDHVKTEPSPRPIQLQKVIMDKETVMEDFGFSLSDGLYDKGVYISAVKEDGYADIAGLLQFDRVLQVNGKKTRNMDCFMVVPLIAEAGNHLELVVCRNILTGDQRIPSQDCATDSSGPSVTRNCVSVAEEPHYENVNSFLNRRFSPKSV
ncbi:hypothetical protein ACJMK2_015398 [Sinanodonta woodiana]|uniref:PDZ domain-containing protein n=1 Tax=Sinanodonta woodiana TaxID=1069815 RepID=A0ABD3UQ71_SINWO